MAGHSRPKDGVLSHAYDPAISLRRALLSLSGSPGHAAARRPGDDASASFLRRIQPDVQLLELLRRRL